MIGCQNIMIDERLELKGTNSGILFGINFDNSIQICKDNSSCMAQIDTDAFLQYSTLATENGNVTAQFNLSEMYFADVVGLNRDKEKGLQCSKVADLRVI
ncbi:unnamed protein product [Rhizophagus irregularis]|nr:unnamed protein product [Rhizophagus irregularis]